MNAVKKPDASGQSVNALEVRVGADKVDFVVNGQVVHLEPKSGALAKTDGIYGIRINLKTAIEAPPRAHPPSAASVCSDAACHQIGEVRRS